MNADNLTLFISCVPGFRNRKMRRLTDSFAKNPMTALYRSLLVTNYRQREVNFDARMSLSAQRHAETRETRCQVLPFATRKNGDSLPLIPHALVTNRIYTFVANARKTG